MIVASAGIANINHVLAGSPIIPKDWSPLHIAAFRNETWRFAELAAAQAIDQRDQLGITPIHVAAEQGNTLAVQFLIGLGSQVNVRDCDNWTPLHYAAASGRLEVIRVLARYSADLNSVASGGTTPLHLATGFDRREAVRLLMELGADGKAVDIYERQAHQAQRRG